MKSSIVAGWIVSLTLMLITLARLQVHQALAVVRGNRDQSR